MPQLEQSNEFMTVVSLNFCIIFLEKYKKKIVKLVLQVSFSGSKEILCAGNFCKKPLKLSSQTPQNLKVSSG